MDEQSQIEQKEELFGQEEREENKAVIKEFMDAFLGFCGYNGIINNSHFSHDKTTEDLNKEIKSLEEELEKIKDENRTLFIADDKQRFIPAVKQYLEENKQDKPDIERIGTDGKTEYDNMLFNLTFLYFEYPDKIGDWDGFYDFNGKLFNLADKLLCPNNSPYYWQGYDWTSKNKIKTEIYLIKQMKLVETLKLSIDFNTKMHDIMLNYDRANFGSQFANLVMDTNMRYNEIKSDFSTKYNRTDIICEVINNYPSYAQEQWQKEQESGKTKEQHIQKISKEKDNIIFFTKLVEGYSSRGADDCIGFKELIDGYSNTYLEYFRMETLTVTQLTQYVKSLILEVENANKIMDKNYGKQQNTFNVPPLPSDENAMPPKLNVGKINNQQTLSDTKNTVQQEPLEPKKLSEPELKSNKQQEQQDEFKMYSSQNVAGQRNELVNKELDKEPELKTLMKDIDVICGQFAAALDDGKNRQVSQNEQYEDMAQEMNDTFDIYNTTGRSVGGNGY